MAPTYTRNIADKSSEGLPASPSATAAPPKATAMKSVLAGFGAGVSKPPNRGSPAPASPAPSQGAPAAGAFGGLVNNLSNAAKKQEQGSSGFEFSLLD